MNIATRAGTCTEIFFSDIWLKWESAADNHVLRKDKNAD